MMRTRFDQLAKHLAYGRELGLAQGERAVVLKQLERRFGPLPAQAIQRVERADPAELDRIAERLLFADTLDAVFGD